MRQESLFETLLDEEVVSSFSAKASANIEKLAELIAMLSIEQSNMRISDLYDELLIKTGYLKDLEEQNTLEAESRIENLMEFKIMRKMIRTSHFLNSWSGSHCWRR